MDAFFVRPVVPDLELFDDQADDSRKLWSLYTTRRLPAISPGARLDLFYIGYENDSAKFDQGEGREVRHTLGARLFGSRGPWRWDQEGAAAALRRAARQRHQRRPRRERPAPRDLQRPVHELGVPWRDRPAGTGQRHAHPGHDGLELGSGWSLTGAATFFWRQSLDDGIYDPDPDVLEDTGPAETGRFLRLQAAFTF